MQIGLSYNEIENQFTPLKEDCERTSLKHSYAVSTIKQIEQIYLHKDEIASISDSMRRTEYVAHLINNKVEGDVFPGRNCDEIGAKIDEIADLLLNAYSHAKNHDKLSEFFYEAFDSDPCLNGRLIALLNYAGKQSGIHVEESPQVGISEENVRVMYPALEDYFYSDKVCEKLDNLTIEGFKNYLQTKPNFMGCQGIIGNTAEFSKTYNYVKLAFV